MTMLRGKVAFVSGATSHTGRAVALSLARQGVHIAAFDRWENDGAGGFGLKLSRLRREVEQMGVRCLALCGDAMKDTDVMIAVAETVVEFRRIDILFNDTHEDLETLETFDDRADHTFRRMWLAARHIIPRMMMRGEGTVITCATEAHDAPQPGGWALYGVASPFAEVENTNIKISAICPSTSSGVRKKLQQDGWTRLSQCQETDLVAAVRDLVVGAVTTPLHGASRSWHA